MPALGPGASHFFPYWGEFPPQRRPSLVFQQGGVQFVPEASADGLAAESLPMSG